MRTLPARLLAKRARLDAMPPPLELRGQVELRHHLIHAVLDHRVSVASRAAGSRCAQFGPSTTAHLARVAETE
jgi:hypothetical protein